MTLTTLAFLVIAITLPVSLATVKNISAYYEAKDSAVLRQSDTKKANA